MHPFSTLSRYFGRHFIQWFVLLLTVLLLIVLLIDTVELLRRASGKPDVTFGVVLRMGLLKLPMIGQQIVPFAILFSAMFTFWRLTRSHELVVARAIGVSAWEFLTPVLIIAATIGLLRIGVVNPIGARLIAEYDRLEETFLKRRTDAFDISHTGLWLRQANEHEQFLIHAAKVDIVTVELQDVVVFRFTDQETFDVRIDAPSARLLPGRWEVRDGMLRILIRPAKPLPTYEIATELTREKIEESFARPETISFWGLPRFIDTLEATGFTAIRHRLHFQSLLAQPFLYCAMVLLAAAFSLRQTRRGGTMLMVSGGIATGFSLFVLTDVVLSLGTTEAVPILMAAWSPTGISLLLGITALLYLEDG